MKRITTTVDPATYARLDDLARHDGVPTARLIREAMERYVTDREAALEPSPLPDWVGMIEGDGEPFAERIDEILAEYADEMYRTEVLGEPKRPWPDAHRDRR
jgi:hypothetical protein